jgi:hypothetical protein
VKFQDVVPFPREVVTGRRRSGAKVEIGAVRMCESITGVQPRSKSDAGSMNSQPPDAGEEESVAQAGSIPETYLQYDFS